jgi:hypothetical protein
VGFGLGVLTTIAVIVAWCVNLVQKPLATEFGGGLTLIGLVIGFGSYWYYRQHRPSVFPLPYRPNRPTVHLLAGMRMQPAEVMVILPHDHEVAASLLEATAQAAHGRPVVFVYRGDYFPEGAEDLLEVTDPYLKDFHARDAFARAERFGRQRGIRDRRYIYVPGNLRAAAMADVWRQVHPRETIVVEGEQQVLPPIAIDRVRRQPVEGATILHLISRKDVLAPISA